MWQLSVHTVSTSGAARARPASMAPCGTCHSARQGTMGSLTRQPSERPRYDTGVCDGQVARTQRAHHYH